MEEICRLCCSTKFVNNHIFDEENALFIKMSLYLPIKLHKGDRLPQQICDKCSCKVNDFYQFCNEAIEVQNRLKVLFSIESKQPEPLIDLTLVKRDTNSPSLRYDKSTQTTEDRGHNVAPNIHIKEEPKQLPAVKEELSDDEFLPCLATDSSDSDDEVLSNIKITKQLLKPDKMTLLNGLSKNVEKKSSKTKNDWTIGFSGKLLTENVNIIQSDVPVNLNVVKHEMYEVKPQDLGLDLNGLVEMGQNVYYCCICFTQMDNKMDMLNHYKVHVNKAELQTEPPPAPPLPEEPPYRCTRCKKTVEKASLWVSHWKRHWARDQRPYRCALCDQTFRDHKQIFKHGQTHKAGESQAGGPSNRYVCDTCPEGFAYMKCLLAHRTRAHPEAASRPLQLRCTVCARVFAHLNSLRRHQRSHTGERNYLCNVCGKALSSREHLKFHIRIHTGYKPNVCGVCGKGFVKKCNLTLHERVHSGEKPHVCSHCGKAFSQRSTLVIHERYHSGARPYVCPLCGRGFVAKGLLSMHLKTACVDHPPPLDKLSARP